MARTIEQQINEANDKLNRLRAKKKKQEARERIVLGSALLAVGRLKKENAQAILSLLDQAKMRESEMRDLQPIIEELRGVK